MIQPTGNPSLAVGRAQHAYEHARVDRPRSGSPAAEQHRAAPASDAAVLSPAAEAHADEMDSAGIREGLVARVRAQLADGSYLSDNKLNTAIDRLADMLLG